MEIVNLPDDLELMFIEAKSFPDGIADAHRTLREIVPIEGGRKYFGLSRPENNSGIVYRAAASLLETGEEKRFGLKTILLQKGRYCVETIRNFPQNPLQIGECFQQLLENPQLDKDGYCVELYLSGNDVQCMVRLTGDPTEKS